MTEDYFAPPEGGRELTALLERSGVDFLREGSRVRFLFTSGGCQWQLICYGQRGRVLVYSVHPAKVTRPETAAAVCSELNGRLVQGSFFVQEERLVLRMGCELIEAIDAQERIARTLEYSAAVMTSFWERLTAAAAGRDLLQGPLL